MPENSLLISGFLAQYACQAIIALFMGSVFLTLSRWKDRPVIRWWVLGWFALAAYLFCAASLMLPHATAPPSPSHDRLTTILCTLVRSGPKIS